MLAKQAWRILHGGDSLLCRSLKARYFPRTDVLLASKPHNPSFTRKSLLVGRDLLLEGIAWKVGNGSRIRLGIDRWLPNGFGNYRAARVNDGWQDSTLSEVMLADDYEWDWEKWANMVQDGELACLPQFVRPMANDDTPFWPTGKFNTYSVKSGYLLACDIAKRNVASSSSSSCSLWHWIWGLEVIPKVKLFMWRGLAGAIPTAMALRGRSIEVDPKCRRCGAHEENLEHALRDCHWAVFLWATSPLRLPTHGNGEVLPISCWFERIRSNPDRETHNLFATVAWVVWYGRNLLLFQNKEVTHQDCFLIARRALCPKLLVPFQSSTMATSVECTRDLQVKVSCDAAIVNGSGAGFGAVISDKDDTFRGCCYDFMTGSVTAEEGEALAGLRGLQMCADRGVPDVVLETDSRQLLYWRLINQDKDPSYIGDITTKILSLANHFRHCAFSWTRREGNAMADKLAKFAVSFHVASFTFF
ncbi:uncharacterized protein LOC131005893 [Salvia miltiorrhiza]|uniref:uncharacterized protein LOC131005893 n=1 Tax=Salvia miltiorrhiza TaxID=226208 RepID=UPI0025AD67C4|nr:uncharacterized protein LOC131005893 [Salvia miltiorrhiza]